MLWWPGWESIAWAGWWSHFWFWFGILCLFALGAAEVVSHVYSLRKDELVAAAEKTRADEQQRRQAEAAKQIEHLRAQQRPRRRAGDPKPGLVAALSPFPGQTVEA